MAAKGYEELAGYRHGEAVGRVFTGELFTEDLKIGTLLSSVRLCGSWRVPGGTASLQEDKVL